MSPKATALAVLASTLLAASPSLADDFDKSLDDKLASKKQAEAEKGEKMPGEKEKKKPEEKRAEGWDPKFDPFEDPDKTYYFVGFRWRDVIVPKFMLNIFADGGRTLNAPMAGPEFTMRKNHMEYDFALQVADYGFAPFLFKGKSDPDAGYELVASTMKMILLNVDILYEIPLEKKENRTGRISLLIGGGIGVGFVAGNMYRSQAYPNTAGADPNKPDQWSACRVPNTTPPWCDNSNKHFAKNGNVYDGYKEPSWAGGGSKPIVFPWLALPQISLRYKPIKQIQTRADLGFSTSGFFFGVSAGYGL
jgi:hypothetical protein